MVKKRHVYKSVSQNYKYFLIGGLLEKTFQVFNLTCYKFVLLNINLSEILRLNMTSLRLGTKL